MSTDRSGEAETLLSRLDLLDRLCVSPAHVRDIIDETGQARSTVHRAIKELEALDLARRGDDGIEATLTGRFARDQLTEYLETLDDILTTHAILAPLPAETDIAYDLVTGADGILATEPAPYRPADRLVEAVSEATAYRALVPTIEESRTVRALYELAVTREKPVELVVSAAVFQTLGSEFPRRMAVLAQADAFTVYVGEVPPYGLGLLERDSDRGRPAAGQAHLVVHAETGGIHGALFNRTDRGVSWATTQYERYRETATDRTVDLLPGDRSQPTRRRESPAIGQSLPVALERDGFVRIDGEYFRNEPVAKPPMAWRAGLSLAEVHTGYAIDRPVQTETDGSRDGRSAEERADDRQGIADSVSEALRDGRNTIVLGPPGSGKSTICKQVACDWYERDRGPVYYREAHHDRSFESIEELVATATAADGHALVVVEDAVRGDAEAIFEVLERIGHREDVSVLLDSRESEWRKRIARSTESTGLEVTYVPPLRERDCERLVDHFERTVERAFDVPAEELWSSIRDETTEGGDRTHELLRLVHRLSTYADPLANEPTALEDAVAAVYDEVANDETARSVCILANVLNAAGIGIDRGLLYAVGDETAFDAVDDAISRLEGRVLFPGRGGRYRTVHEEWSTALLAHVIEAAGAERAAEQFGTVVSDVLALAADPARIDRIAGHVDGPFGLAEIRDEPRRWVDETVEAVYAVGEHRSQLAPLFGDGKRDRIDLPKECSDATVRDIPIWLGELFLAGGYYDRAERAFERIPNDTIAQRGERLLGLARVAINRGAYDEAIDSCRACLSLLEGKDRPTLCARAHRCLGRALADRGDYDEAEPHYDAALEAFRAQSRPGQEARTLHLIGAIASDRGDYDRALEYFESSLEIRRELGDRRGEAEVLNSMGNVAWHRGANDRAAELFEQHLEIMRSIGDRHAVANCLNNLGVVAFRRERYDRAIEFYERSLEGSRRVGDRPGVAKALHNLGGLQQHLDNFDAAIELLEESLEIKREIGDTSLVITTTTTLGTIAGQRGDFPDALAYQEQALELAREIGDRHRTAKCLHNIGQINARQGNVATATEYYNQSVEIKEELADRSDMVQSLTNLGLIAGRQGDVDRAREYGERALEIATEVGLSHQIAGSHHCLGEIARLSDEIDRAGERFDAALEAVEDEESLIGLEIRLGMAKLARDRDDNERARSIAREVREGATDVQAAFWVAQADRFLGQLAAEEGEGDAARECYLNALEYFESVEAYHFAMETLAALVETADEDDAIDEWDERARALLACAPEEVVERHPGWRETSATRD
ncbi:TPR repeat-containing protein [Halovivax ruber XH-70]|uniref:TPR repeat-containing protein n=1 Tax=Halovivax ruber (strain DSM 18193 / JCM 13892 / XH-70) TaxID=797302 RepID=L0I5M5_HALRX|nr:tetratricopeptide repeat protein [Halovivax ruber]AGB14805.1 TPR repeat-containing protein [Halovivax ruber XH-70]